MKLDLAYEEVLPHPVEAVWAELTEAAAISDWLMATDDFRPVLGCRFRLKWPDPPAWVEAEVLEIEPQNRMVWSWSVDGGTPSSTVTFELAAIEAGTRLRIRHVGEVEAALAERLRGGWPGRIIALAELIGRSRVDD